MDVEDLKIRIKNYKERELKRAIEDIEERIVRNAKHGINCLKITTDKNDIYMYDIDKWMVKPIIEHFRSNGFKVEVKGEKHFFGWLEGLLDIYDPNEIITISWEV